MSVAIRLYQNEEKHQKPLELSSILVPDDGRSERGEKERWLKEYFMRLQKYGRNSLEYEKSFKLLIII